VSAVWEDEPRPYSGAAMAVVSLVNSDNLGSAGLEYTEVVQGWAYGDSWGGEVPELREDAEQLTAITLRVKFECMAHTRGLEAEGYAEKLRGRLYSTEAIKGLEAIGLGFTSVGLATSIKQTYDERIRSTYVLDLRFHAANVSSSIARYSRINNMTTDFTAMRVPQ
jgi:hypothetical protein